MEISHRFTVPSHTHHTILGRSDWLSLSPRIYVDDVDVDRPSPASPDTRGEDVRLIRRQRVRTPRGRRPMHARHRRAPSGDVAVSHPVVATPRGSGHSSREMLPPPPLHRPFAPTRATRRPRRGRREHRGHRRVRRQGHVRRHQPPRRRGSAGVRRRRHPLRGLQLPRPVQGQGEGAQAVRGILRRDPRRHALHRGRVHRRRRTLRGHDVVRGAGGRAVPQRQGREFLPHRPDVR